MEDRTDIIRKMIRESYLASDPEEEDRIAAEVAGLLGNVDVLAGIEVSEEFAAEARDPFTLRPDGPAPSVAVDDALANAPRHHDGFVSVPKVIPAAPKGKTP